MKCNSSKSHLLEEIADAEIFKLNVGKCEGQCQEENVARTEHCCRGQYADRKVTPVYKLCGHCAMEFEQYWDDMWNEYYSSVL